MTSSKMKDRYGNELSTTSTAARDAYVRGVDSLMSATAGTDTAFADAVAADDGFALAHIGLARAKQLLGRGHEAKVPRARALELAAGTTPREQSQIAIFDKILTGQGEAALAAIHEHMKDWPRDAMAFTPATSVFGLIGFSGRVGREAEQLAVLEPFENFLLAVTDDVVHPDVAVHGDKQGAFPEARGMGMRDDVRREKIFPDAHKLGLSAPLFQSQAGHHPR